MHLTILIDHVQPRDSLTPEHVARVPSESGDDAAPGHGALPLPTESTDAFSVGRARPSKESKRSKSPEVVHGSSTPAGSSEKEPTLKPKRSTKGVEPFEKWERDEMEKLLGQLCGHLGLSFGCAHQAGELIIVSSLP
jgi:phospholipase D1/2